MNPEAKVEAMQGKPFGCTSAAADRVRGLKPGNGFDPAPTLGLLPSAHGKDSP
jgi:hypothetical protein